MKNPATSLLLRGLATGVLTASLTAGCSETVPPPVKTFEPTTSPAIETITPTPLVTAEALQSPVTTATPKPAPKPTPRPTGRPRASTKLTARTTHSLRGNATWYRYVPGGAAAGPNLRRAMGSHWRGRVVTVCRKSCVRVRLSDWCLCSRGNRIIDLDHRAFDALGSLSEGVIPVTVKW